jgi:A/G-specific adenine glycosylase
VARRKTPSEPEAGELWKDEELARLQRALLAWYDASRRDLPWRRTRDPYAIWLSEVMLQQTRVEAVIPYYERFLERFPDVATLAASPIESVLPYWSGLGYYRRIRNFHAAVREVAESYGGAVPSDERFAELPGVGPYTQAAVRSIAFQVPVPLIDGNVERVLARLLLCRDEVKKSSTQRSFHAFLERWLDRSRAGDFNQALMELGATVCTPRSPRCAACPLEASCRAHRFGAEEELPRLPARAPTFDEAWVVLVLRRGEEPGELWLEPREERGLLEGLWEFPTWIGLERRDLARTLAAEARGAFALLRERGLERAYELGRERHAILNRRIRAEILELPLPARAPQPTPRGRWVAPERVAELPIGGFTKKVLRRLGEAP